MGNSLISNFCTLVKISGYAGALQQERHSWSGPQETGIVKQQAGLGACAGLSIDFHWSTRRWGGPSEYQSV